MMRQLSSSPILFFFKYKKKKFLIILKEQGGMLFTDRLTFTKTSTFNKLKLQLLIPSECHCQPQKAACFVQVIQKWLDGHHLAYQMVQCRGQGKTSSAVCVIVQGKKGMSNMIPNVKKLIIYWSSYIMLEARARSYIFKITYSIQHKSLQISTRS